MRLRKVWLGYRFASVPVMTGKPGGCVSEGLSGKRLQDSAYSGGEVSRGSNQAEDQITVAGEIVKMSGMHQHRLFAQQRDGQFLIRPRHRYAQHGVPSAFYAQPLA